MIDLETMGTGSDAAIVALGAVFFDETGLGDTFYEKISLESSVNSGLKMDASTVLWWMKQSDIARKEIYSSSANNVEVVLDRFSSFVDSHAEDMGWEPYYVLLWGNGSSFDNVILKNAYKQCKIDSPFEFWCDSWNDRDYRTLCHLFPDIKKEPFEGTAHNALDDSINQARHAVKILREIAKTTKPDGG
jgi:hypothetical protein